LRQYLTLGRLTCLKAIYFKEVCNYSRGAEPTPLLFLLLPSVSINTPIVGFHLG
jgi:hypothetical protein